MSARADKPTPGFPISTSENGYYRSHPLRDFIVDALAPSRPRRRARISIGVTAIIITPALFSRSTRSEQWLFGFSVRLPLILPGRVLSGNGEVRDIFPYLDEAQLD